MSRNAALSLLMSFLLPALASTFSWSPLAAAQDKVTIGRYLVDDLETAVLDVPGMDQKKLRSPVNDDGTFQPYYHATAKGPLGVYHRRVTLYDRSRAFRDRRDALVLPVPGKLTFPVGAAVGDRFAVVPRPLMKGGGEAEVTWKVLCDDKELLSGKGKAVQPSSLKTWPDVQVAALNSACKTITLATESTDKKANGAVMVWEGARVESWIAASAVPKYNIVFIVVDALRSDVVGVHNTVFPSVTPHIDALEKTGTTFPQASANGNTTLLSMNTMLLGTHPRALDFLTLWWSGKDRRESFYERKPPFLPLLLHRAGYVTLAAVHDHLYFPPYQYSVDPGFDIMQDCGRDTTDHPILTQEAIDFMTKNKDRRFLVQLNLLGPHQPYSPPKECLDKATHALKGLDTIHIPSYVGEACWVDIHVGKVRAALKELGLEKNTIVLLTADHGEVMDRKHSCLNGRDGSHSMHLHGVTLYEEELNVPLMFSLPGVIRSQVSKVVAQHVDILPTLMALLGLKIPENLTGRTLDAHLTKGTELPDVPAYSERWLSRAVKLGGWKLIWHTRKDSCCAPSAKETCKKGDWGELYHVAEDPGERIEVSAKHPEKLEELRKLISETRERFYQMTGGTGPNP